MKPGLMFWAWVVLLCFTACAPTVSPPTHSAASPIEAMKVPAQVIALPTPRRQGSLTLEETLARRRSVREFADTP
ncbi:MAG: hypothetical protein AB1817_19515, partial [Chloroflexota bacterium]